MRQGRGRQVRGCRPGALRRLEHSQKKNRGSAAVPAVCGLEGTRWAMDPIFKSDLLPRPS